MELPPRARRILFHRPRQLVESGTTSACAENTASPSQSFHKPRNYLRVRGEYRALSLVKGTGLELPPRARRILGSSNPTTRVLGTTSACAENTLFSIILIILMWNYLRVRGEYLKKVCELTPKAELPPRARRIPGANGIYASPPGTTSACAENTPGSVGRETRPGNYLRVRGEYCGPPVGWH